MTTAEGVESSAVIYYVNVVWVEKYNVWQYMLTRLFCSYTINSSRVINETCNLHIPAYSPIYSKYLKRIR